MSHARPPRLVIGLVLVAVVVLGPILRAQAKVRIAVAYFANRSGRKQLEPLKRGLADMLITDLAAASDITVVERDRLQSLIAELKLQRNPYFDKRSAGKLGKGLGAAYLVTGAFLLVGDTLSLEARVVDIESSKVVLTARQQGKTHAFFALQTGLAKKLIAGLGATLTLIGKKKIGARGSRSFAAFGQYSRSLAARDRGDRKAERAALAKALAADPSFVAAKARLMKLEGRVARLERAGGLIVTPRSAADHLHNARLHVAAGRESNARASALAALAQDPLYVQAWWILGQLSRAPSPRRLAQLKLSPRQRALVMAYLRKADGALAARLPSLVDLIVRKRSIAHPLAAALGAALLFRRTNRPPPLPAARDVVRLHRATLLLRRARLRKQLRPHLATANTLLAQVDAVYRRRFAGPIKRAHGFGLLAMLLNRSVHRRPSAYWDLNVVLFDWLRGPLKVRLRKQPAHPGWRDPPVAPAYLVFARNSFYRLPPAVKAAIGDPRKLVLRAQYPDRGHRAQPTLRVAPFGSWVTFQADALRCRADAGSPTGQRCGLLIAICKGNLLPGPYALDVAYQHQGRTTRLVYPLVWALDVKLLSRPPRTRRMRMGWLRRLIHRVTPANRAGYAQLPELAGARPDYRMLVDVEPVYAENHGPGHHSRRAAWMHKHIPYPVASLHYDVDCKLLGGCSKLPDGYDFTGWRRYRRRIMQRGRRRPAQPYRDQFLPLPDLKPGHHKICIVERHHNGALSAEPDCKSFDVR